MHVCAREAEQFAATGPKVELVEVRIVGGLPAVSAEENG